MFRIKKYVCLLMLSAAVSCGPAVDHQMIMEEKGMIMVNVDRKLSVEELKEFAHYYFDDYQQDNFLMVKFCVPSKYPDYPETPWAQVIIDGLNVTGDHPQVTVTVYGALDESEEQRLTELNPGIGQVKGKWYWHEPMMEGVYFLVENSADTILYGYRANGYYESDQEGWENGPVIETSNWDHAGPHMEYRLSKINRNEYCIVPDSVPSFRINEKNELIWNRVKTGKDTSLCVLLPLPIN